MAGNFFADLAPATGPQRSPGVIMGPAKVRDPSDIRRDEREEIKFEERDKPTAPSGYRFKADGTLEAIPGGPGRQPQDPKLVEAERTAAFLATRLQGSLADIATATKGAPDANRPTMFGTVAGLFGQEAGNWANTPERQRVEAAQMDALDAALTLGTGAAYSREQLDAYRQSYFPLMSDDETTVADKRVRFRRLLEAAKLKAGNAAPQIDEAIAALGGVAEAEKPLPGDQFKTQLAERLKKGDDFAGIIAMWKTQYGTDPTPDQMNRLAAGFGNRDTRVETTPGSSLFQDVAGMTPGQAGDAFYRGVGDVAETVGDTLGLVANPINAGINAVAGTNIGTDLGASFRAMTGAPDNDPNSGYQSAASAINRGAVGAVTFGGLAGQAAKAVPGAVGNALSSFGGSTGFNALSGATSGGAGEIARQSGAGPVGQGIASLAGGIAGGSAALRMAPRAAAQPNALMAAGKSEGVTVNRAMADPNVQPRTAGVQATMIGGPIVNSAMAKVGGQIEGRVTALGRGGQAVEPAVGGDIVRDAATRDIKASGVAAKRQYDRAEKLAGDAKIDPAQARAEIDGITSRLSETANTNSAELSYLSGLADDLSKGISVGGLRDLRTTLRQRIAKGELTFGANEARVLGIMDKLSKDIEGGLTAQGKGDAATAFRQADDFYRQRQEFITGTVQKVIGKRNANLPAEQVFSRFSAMASPKGDSAGLAKMMRTMKDDETADIAATFASQLGRNGKGEFSTAFLASQAQKLPQAARMNLFGPEGAQSLANLQKLATEHARVMSGLNSSKTGMTIDYRSWMLNALLSGGTAVASGSALPVAVGVGVAGVKGGKDALTARMVMSPDITKWLATAPRTKSPQAINNHFGRLTAIASKNPALQTDIAALKESLMQAANDVPGRVAASGSNAENQNADGGKPPPQ